MTSVGTSDKHALVRVYPHFFKKSSYLIVSIEPIRGLSVINWILIASIKTYFPVWENWLMRFKIYLENFPKVRGNKITFLFKNTPLNLQNIPFSEISKDKGRLSESSIIQKRLLYIFIVVIIYFHRLRNNYLFLKCIFLKNKFSGYINKIYSWF